MKSISIFFVCIGLVLTVLAAGCAKPPTDEMNNAAEAVTRAENDPDAAAYAANTITRARDALARMRTEADSKRYDAAKSYAAEAIAAAERAITEGRAAAARARTEAASLVDEVNRLLTETGQRISAAETAKLEIDFAAVQGRFNAARQNAELAQSALSGNRYDDTMNLGRSVRSELADINLLLANAATAVSRKK